MRALFLILALVAAAPRGSAAPPQEGMEGTYWKVRDDDFQSKIFFWRFDYVAFRDGSFRSRRFDARGYSAAPYTMASSRAGETAWTATITDGGDGKVVWEGRRTGSRMEGTWTWIRSDAPPETTAWSAKEIDRLPPR